MRVEKRFGIKILSVGLVLGWAGHAMAEDKPASPPPAGERAGRGGPEGRGMEPGKMIERMQKSFESLNLSDEQKPKVKAAFEKIRTDLEAAMKDTAGQEPRDRIAKAREVLQPAREQLLALLDDTQKEKLKQMREEAGPRGGGPGGDGPRGREGVHGEGEGRRPGGPEGGPGEGPGRGGRPPEPSAMVDRLSSNLEKLDLTPEQKTKATALLAETKKTLEAQHAEDEKAREASRAKSRETIDANHAKLDEILTPEQKTKLKEMMPPPPDGRGRPERDGAPK